MTVAYAEAYRRRVIGAAVVAASMILGYASVVGAGLIYGAHLYGKRLVAIAREREGEGRQGVAPGPTVSTSLGEAQHI